MMRKLSKTKLNICISVLHQFFTIACGILLSWITLRSFGSENNGLIQSIGQILGYTALLEGGIGGVMRATLYKPLAENDSEGISKVFHSGKKVFDRISLVFIVFIAILSVSMKFAVNTEFDWLYVFLMVLILGAHTYCSYYSAISHRLLLVADQKLYIIQLFQIVSTVLNLILCITAIYLGAGVHLLKLLTAAVALLNPIFFRAYVNKHYSLPPPKKGNTYSLPQRGDGIIHHLAYFIHRNTDIVILSLFTDLISVSVYSVYHSVITVLENLLSSVSLGIAGRIGELWARKETKELNETVSAYEVCNTALSFSVAVVCYILILPYVSIYTAGVSDANYIQPLFAAILVLGNLAQCLMLPYSATITSAGHYKETKLGATGEVLINLVLSLILVRPLGLVGVAVGTLAAMLFRLSYSIWYLSKAILERPVYKALSCILPNALLAIVLIKVFSATIEVTAGSILTLLVSAINISLIVFPSFALLTFLLYTKQLKKFLKTLR